MTPDCLIEADTSMSKVTPRSGRCQQQLASLLGPLTSHKTLARHFKAGWSSTHHGAGSRWWSLPLQTHQEAPLSLVEEQHRQVQGGAIFLMLQAHFISRT